MSESADAPTVTADELVAVRKEIAQLRQRISDLEDQMGPSESTLPPAAKDYRDARVLERLDEGEVVTLKRLQVLYQEFTDVKDRDTMRDRIEHLVQTPAFNRLAFQKWQYVGPGDGGSA